MMHAMETLPAVGFVLPALHLEPLTRATLALYAGGSGDHIPLHIDSDFARAAGYPDAFMQGMLGAAYITRLATNWVPQECLRGFALRFQAITYPGEVLSATGTVISVNDDRIVEVDVALRNAAGETKIAGRLTLDMSKAAPAGAR